MYEYTIAFVLGTYNGDGIYTQKVLQRVMSAVMSRIKSINSIFTRVAPQFKTVDESSEILSLPKVKSLALI